jgi:hypothetical protein
MRRRAPALATCAAAALLALSLSACGGGGYKTRTLHLNETNTSDFGFADAPPKTKVGKQGPQSFSPGDGISFRSVLSDASKKPVGELNAGCVITHAGTFDTAKAQCTATATVPGGDLTLSVGGRFGGGTTRGAIVGGTGDYKGAGGTFESANSNAPSKDTFDIQIPQK